VKTATLTRPVMLTKGEPL